MSKPKITLFKLEHYVAMELDRYSEEEQVGIRSIIANASNEILSQALGPEVFGRHEDGGSFWSFRNDHTDTHRARLIFVEEIK